MNDSLDIIPIHVFANSANKAEILNGQLRAQGLAVKPLWRMDTEDDGDLSPELVFLFEDTEHPSLDEVMAYAQRQLAPLIVVAHEYDSQAAQRALSAGAADWLLIDQDVLLSAAVRRERRYIHDATRIRLLERDQERNHMLLKQNFIQSQDAILTVNEGILIEANGASAEYFGYPDPQALVGLPVMDLVGSPSQKPFKKALKNLFKRGEPQQMDMLELLKADGSMQKSPVRLERFEDEGESCARIVIANNPGGKIAEQISALEDENKALLERLDSLQLDRPDFFLTQPRDFSPLASQLLDSVQADGVRAVVCIRPENWQAAHTSFGSIGAAELGARLGESLAGVLDGNDLATRTADLNLVILATRPDTDSLERWIQSTVNSLGEKVFEGGEHSGQVGFVAGYTPVNRIRKLDVLIHQAEEAAIGEAGTVTPYAGNAASADSVEVDDDSWGTLIREALTEHRYTVTLQPVEDLGSGALAQVAEPCLLDRDGQRIEAATFQPPALRLGLLQVLEHRFVGHAMRALLSSLKKNGNARIIAPIHHETAVDTKLQPFLQKLVGSTPTASQAERLVLELQIDDIISRVREVQEFSERIQALGFSLGLRGYSAAAATDKLVTLLPIKSLRLSAEFTAELEGNVETSELFKHTVELNKERGVDVIATDVSNSGTMACLYNLGISMVEGPIIGEPELFLTDDSGGDS
ncbi:MAG: EAL domain-containing protein [Gammaproteobacteria bacterium]|nr:EAL domain-containing protein [Gammaproteobacteria bacterium]